MLVLTRKLMERLYIGDEICVTVVRLEGGQVRLGIDAPRHIPVVRGELTRRPAAPEPAAAQQGPGAPIEGERSPVSRPEGGTPETGSRPRGRFR
jgi:carbon storage regulator